MTKNNKEVKSVLPNKNAEERGPDQDRETNEGRREGSLH